MNDKIKSLFFSQYALQEVWCNDIFYVPIRLSFDKIQHQFETDKDYLLLRDISQLTDDEKKVIAKYSYFGDNIPLSNVDALFSDYLHKASIINGASWWVIQDYLRSIGTLLPFTYLSETNQPITLTPAEIIDLGWAKFQSNEQ
jgi:hypothetical protein